MPPIELLVAEPTTDQPDATPEPRTVENTCIMYFIKGECKGTIHTCEGYNGGCSDFTSIAKMESIYKVGMESTFRQVREELKDAD